MIFSNSLLNTYYTSESYNNIYETMMTWYNTTRTSNNKADINIFYQFLKGSNRTKIQETMAMIRNTTNKDFMNRYNNLEKENILKKSQNDNTKQTFIEKYLYVIIKCIFIVILFIVLITKLSIFNLDLSNLNQQLQKII